MIPQRSFNRIHSIFFVTFLVLCIITQHQAKAVESTEVVQKTFWTKVLDVVQNTIAPEIEYVRLLSRYRSWYQKYNSIWRPPMKEARQVLLEEYAKVDEQILNEACHIPATTAQNNNQVTFDHIHRALAMMIVNLENSLNDLINHPENLQLAIQNEYRQGFSGDSNPVEDEHVKMAMDRIRGTLISKARSLFMSEAKKVAQIAVSNAAAAFVAEQQKLDPGSPLGYLGPIIGLVGSASTPLLSSYFRSIETRTALAAISTLHPMDYICKLNPLASKITG